TTFVHTLHGRLDLPMLRDVFRAFPCTALVSISDSQRDPLAGSDLNWRSTVHHGLPIDEIPFTEGAGRGGYLAFLGRLSGEKGPEMAVAVAHEVGILLLTDAITDPDDREYFERVLRPLLNGTFIPDVVDL